MNPPATLASSGACNRSRGLFSWGVSTLLAGGKRESLVHCLLNILHICFPHKATEGGAYKEWDAHTAPLPSFSNKRALSTQQYTGSQICPTSGGRKAMTLNITCHLLQNRSLTCSAQIKVKPMWRGRCLAEQDEVT